MHARLRRPAVALITTTLAASVLGIAPAAHAADATLSGTVTGSESGDGLAGVEVSVFGYDPVDEYWTTIEDGYTSTDEDGDYSIDVPEGDYRLGFFDYNGGHIGEYYADVADVDDGTTVPVGGATPAVVDVALDPGAHVSGTVTRPGGTGLGQVLVTVYEPVEEDGDTWNDWVGSTYTMSDGSYDIGGLATGEYVVEFSDDDSSFDEVTTWATEWYDDVTTSGEADLVAVTAPATTADVDAELGADAQFSGTITDESGVGVRAFVQAYTQVGAEWEYAASGYSDLDGSYVLEGLRPGTYRVQFYGWVAGHYAEEYWNDKGRITDASDVVVSASDPVAGIDAVLVPGEHDGDYAVQNVTAPVITGSPQVGSPLTASAGTWSPTPSMVEYYWVAGDDVLQEGTSPTYVPKAADLGRTISVWVYASADGYDYGYAHALTSGAVVAAPAPPAPAPNPAPTPTPTPTVDVPTALTALVAGLDVAGKPKVGKTVKVKGLDKLLRATRVSYKFTWFAGAKKVKKATTSKLKITRAMKGKKISVKVTARAASTSKTVKLKVGKVA